MEGSVVFQTRKGFNSEPLFKSNHKGRGWQWTPVVDWRFKSFPCPGFSVWASSYFKKRSHQQFTVKREVPCHTTKFEPCLTFGPPPCKIYPVVGQKLHGWGLPSECLDSNVYLKKIKLCSVIFKTCLSNFAINVCQWN